MRRLNDIFPLVPFLINKRRDKLVKSTRGLATFASGTRPPTKISSDGDLPEVVIWVQVILYLQLDGIADKIIQHGKLIIQCPGRIGLSGNPLDFRP